MNIYVGVNHIINSLNTYGNKYNISTKKTKAYEDKNAASVKGLCSDLKNNCHKLYKTDFSVGASTNVMIKVAKFVDSYNKLVESSSKTENSTLTKQLKEMKKLITNNEDTLKKIGIEYKDNKLVLDKDEIKDIKSQKKFDDLFKGTPSFISSMQKYASKAIASLKVQTVDMEVPHYETISLSNSASSFALSVNSLNGTLSSLSKQQYDESNRASLLDLINNYTIKYNDMLDKYSAHSSVSTDAENECLQDIIASTANSSAAFSSIGISINASDNKLVAADSNILDSADITYMSDLFSNSDYSSNVKTASTNLFEMLVDADRAGISINGYA